MTIDSLIDKQDNFEIIRDEIAALLVTEVASQMQLADDAGEDPSEWKLRVFSERSNPFEQFLNTQTDKSPIVNIWYDSSSFIEAGSNVVEQQKVEAIYNIDCYGYGISSSSDDGHVPGDRDAALEVQRALRLVRNILMAATYTYLGQRGLVWKRWVESVKCFQPELNGQAMQQIVGARLSFRVTFSEFSPQVPSVNLELVSVDVKRAEDGEIVINADYDYT